jgi:hypothetical protein
MSRFGATLQKFGLGLTAEEFDARRDAGEVMRHLGFAQSIAARATGLEWNLDGIEVDPVMRDVIASSDCKGANVDIPAGAPLPASCTEPAD